MTAIVFDRSLRHIDQDGRLHVEKCNISKANVCPYYGREIPNWEELKLDPARIYNLYRDPTELSKAASTYHNVPLMVKHVAVSADDPKKDSIVGTVSNIEFQHPYLTGSLAVWTQEGIDLVQSGKQEQLSAGYRYRADMTPGVIDGAQFDGVMRDLQCNHVALVAEGRAGPDVVVSDQFPMRLFPMKYESLRPFLAPDADPKAFALAFDKAMDEEKEEAEDKSNDCYGNTADAWEKMDAKDRKKARDEWKAAKDEAEAKAKDAKEDDDKDDKDDKAKDSAITADQLSAAVKAGVELARKQTAELFEAREAVKPIVGVVAMDSAEDVYAFALKHAGVNVTGVHPSAYRALLDVLKTRKPVERKAIAMDATAGLHTITSIWPAARKRA